MRFSRTWRILFCGFLIYIYISSLRKRTVVFSAERIWISFGVLIQGLQTQAT